MATILYLSHCVPYPPNKGDRIRAYHEVRHLAARHDVHLACLTQERDATRHREKLGNWCRGVKIVPFSPRRAKLGCLPALLTPLPLTVSYFYHRELQEQVNRLLRTVRFDAVLCFSSPMAEYIIRAVKAGMNWKADGTRPRLIMDFCDLDSDKWRQYAASSRWPMNWIYGREALELLAYERRVNRIFDQSVFISRPEVEMFRRRYPGARNLAVVANGVDREFFRSGAVAPADVAGIRQSGGPMLLFTGAMDYQANVDGVLWFYREIYPLIRREVPDVRFFIVGSRPAAAIKKLDGHDGVTVTGFVDDIRLYYAAADLAVVPLRLARGVQNKILEAMSMEKAVVATTRALEGIAAQPGRDLLVADEPRAFAHRVVELLTQREATISLGIQGRRFVERRHDWEENMKTLEELMTAFVVHQ